MSLNLLCAALIQVQLDSDPEREYYETLKKAEALIKTLEVLRFFSSLSNGVYARPYF